MLFSFSFHQLRMLYNCEHVLFDNSSTLMNKCTFRAANIPWKTRLLNHQQTESQRENTHCIMYILLNQLTRSFNGNTNSLTITEKNICLALIELTTKVFAHQEMGNSIYSYYRRIMYIVEYYCYLPKYGAAHKNILCSICGFFQRCEQSTVTIPAQCHLYYKSYGAAVTTFHDATSFNVKIITKYYKKRWLANLVQTFWSEFFRLLHNI